MLWGRKLRYNFAIMPEVKVRFVDPEAVRALVISKVIELGEKVTNEKMGEVVGLKDPQLLIKSLNGGSGRRSWFEDRLRCLGVSPKEFDKYLVIVTDDGDSDIRGGEKTRQRFFTMEPRFGFNEVDLQKAILRTGEQNPRTWATRLRDGEVKGLMIAGRSNRGKSYWAWLLINYLCDLDQDGVFLWLGGFKIGSTTDAIVELCQKAAGSVISNLNQVEQFPKSLRRYLNYELPEYSDDEALNAFFSGKRHLYFIFDDAHHVADELARQGETPLDRFLSRFGSTSQLRLLLTVRPGEDQGESFGKELDMIHALFAGRFGPVNSLERINLERFSLQESKNYLNKRIDAYRVQIASAISLRRNFWTEKSHSSLWPKNYKVYVSVEEMLERTINVSQNNMFEEIIQRLDGEPGLLDFVCDQLDSFVRKSQVLSNDTEAMGRDMLLAPIENSEMGHTLHDTTKSIANSEIDQSADFLLAVIAIKPEHPIGWFLLQNRFDRLTSDQWMVAKAIGILLDPFLNFDVSLELDLIRYVSNQINTTKTLKIIEELRGYQVLENENPIRFCDDSFLEFFYSHDLRESVLNMADDEINPIILHKRARIWYEEHNNESMAVWHGVQELSNINKKTTRYLPDILATFDSELLLERLRRLVAEFQQFNIVDTKRRENFRSDTFAIVLCIAERLIIVADTCKEIYVTQGDVVTAKKNINVANGARNLAAEIRYRYYEDPRKETVRQLNAGKKRNFKIKNKSEVRSLINEVEKYDFIMPNGIGIEQEILDYFPLVNLFRAQLLDLQLQFEYEGKSAHLPSSLNKLLEKIPTTQRTISEGRVTIFSDFEAAAYIALGVFFNRIAQFDKAIEAYHQADAILTVIENKIKNFTLTDRVQRSLIGLTQDHLRVNVNLGRTVFLKEGALSAIQFAKKIYQTFKNFNKSATESTYGLDIWAYSLIANNQLQEALDVIKICFEQRKNSNHIPGPNDNVRFVTSGDIWIEGQGWSNLAAIFAYQGDYNLAKKYLVRAASCYEYDRDRKFLRINRAFINYMQARAKGNLSSKIVEATLQAMEENSISDEPICADLLPVIREMIQEEFRAHQANESPRYFFLKPESEWSAAERATYLRFGALLRCQPFFLLPFLKRGSLVMRISIDGPSLGYLKYLSTLQNN